MLDFLACFLTAVTAITASPYTWAENWVLQEKKGTIELYAQVSLESNAVWEAVSGVSQELNATLDIEGSDELIQIMVFRDHRAYLNYLGSRLPQARYRKAIYFRNGKVSQIYAWHSRSLLVDLRHEMVHVLLHQHLPFLPLWLDEGLAEYFEETEAERNASGRMTAVRWKARLGQTPSLTFLESIPSAEQMDSDAYRDSWAWACLMINESPESLETLRTYVRDIHRGEAPEPMSRFGPARNTDFQERANSYFRKMKIRLSSR